MRTNQLKLIIQMRIEALQDKIVHGKDIATECYRERIEELERVLGLMK